MLSCLRDPEGFQKEYCPVECGVYLPNRYAKMVQQLNKSLHPYPLESLVSNEVDGEYNGPPQPW